MKLTKGIFGTESAPNLKNEFEIYTGQTRGGYRKLVYRAGWYNYSGVRLGWGDLSTDDFEKIQSEIGSNESFIILPENRSFNKYIKKIDLEDPGKEYILDNMVYAITRTYMFFINDQNRHIRGGQIGEDSGIYIYSESRKYISTSLRENFLW